VPKIATVGQMRAIEKAADSSGLTYAMMMENAGRSVAQAILGRIPDVGGKRVVILVGAGNNGGDGLVAGNHLAEAGAQVAVYLTKPRPEDDPHLARLRQRGLLIAEAGQDQRMRVLANLLSTADLLIDGVLGTGFKLPMEGAAREVLSKAKEILHARDRLVFVAAVDCPSGLNCDTGEIAGEALQSDLTVTLAAVKPGLLRFPGAEYVGELVVGDIGLPADFGLLAEIRLEMAAPADLRKWLPMRPRDAHKGTFGRVLIVAGSVNYPGAVALAGLAAYRVGAGLVTLAAPQPIQPLIAALVPEATWILLPHELGAIAKEAAAVLEQPIAGSTCLLLGPGLGQEECTADFLVRLLGAEAAHSRGKIGFVREGKESRETTKPLPPCVIDADGLKLLTQVPDWAQHLPCESILTPHPGEMAVLTGLPKDEIQSDRVAAAQHWATAWGHIVVLKGAYTVVAEPSGRAVVIPFATPALARAGTGDVLAGAIAGFRAQGTPPFEAAVLGAYLHGRAGELAFRRSGSTASVLARDVGEALPEALRELTSR